MIPSRSQWVEGRKLGTKATAEGFTDNEESERRQSAEIGSNNLLDAIFRSRGIEPPVRNVPAPPPKRAKVHAIQVCPTCGAPRERRLTIKHIQATVAAYYGLPANSMTSRDQRYCVVHPRQMAMLLCSEFTPKSMSEIARRFCKSDHTTVIHAVRAARKRIDTDEEIAMDAEALRAGLAI